MAMAVHQARPAGVDINLDMVQVPAPDRHIAYPGRPWNPPVYRVGDLVSIPAAATTSVTVAAECLMRVSSMTSLRRMNAPGVSWVPSMIRMARWMVAV